MVVSPHRVGSQKFPRAKRVVRITHRASGTIIAEGPSGLFGILRFEGNYYIRRRYLRGAPFKPNFMPGFCVYKFIYVWLDLALPGEPRDRFAGWIYVLPNPLFAFIAFRPAVSAESGVFDVEVLPGQAQPISQAGESKQNVV